MNLTGPAKRLTIIIGESDQWRHRPLWLAILETLKQQGLAGATVLRGQAGFGAHSRIHTATLEALSIDLPVVILVVDTPDRLEAILPIIGPMIREGLMTLEDVQVLHYSHRYLSPLPRDRQVGDVMRREVTTVEPNTPVAQVVTALLERGVKAVPVLDDAGQVVGIITGGDLLQRGRLSLRLGLHYELTPAELRQFLQELAAGDGKASDIMTTPVITVDLKSTLEHAAHLMLSQNLKRLPVVDEQGRLLGIVSRADLLRTVAHAARLGAITPETLPAGATWVHEVMSRDVPTVHPDTPVPEVLDRLVATSFRRVVVVDADRHVLGIILDSDLLRQTQPEARPGLIRALANRLAGRHALAAATAASTAQEVMERQVLTVCENDTLATAIQNMMTHRTKRLIVLNAQDQLAGILDRRDALRALV